MAGSSAKTFTSQDRDTVMLFVMDGAEAEEGFGKMLSAKFTKGNMRAAKAHNVQRPTRRGTLPS